MPKAIKKKITKKIKSEENIVETLQESIKQRQKTIFAGVGAVLVLALILAGYFWYTGSRETTYEELSHSGYQLFYGITVKNTLLPAERYRKALADFTEASKIKKTPYVLYYIGACQYELGNYQEALKTLNDLNAAFPTDQDYLPLSRYKIAMIYMKMGNQEEALKSLDTLANSPLRATALSESAALLKSMGKTDEAEKKIEQLKKEFPDSPYLKAEQKPEVKADSKPAPTGKKKK